LTPKTWVLGLMLTVLCATSAQAQALDDAAVGAALQAGVAKKYSDMVSLCIAGPGFGAGLGGALAGGIQPTGAFTVTTSGAQGRLAALAAEGKRLYKPFTLADVTPELRDASTAFISVDPHSPTKNQNTLEVASPIDRIVLKSKASPDRVLQPSDIKLTPQQWSNLMGGKVDGTSALATFPVAGIKELPPGDIDVVIITAAGERRCKISDKDRARLFSK
jgi:hypothetical protein